MKIPKRSFASFEQRKVFVPESDQPTRVKQEFVKEVNINDIVAKMKRGISPPPWMTQNTPRYEDLASYPTSFQEAFDVVERARLAFEALPLEFRREIDHDPRNLDTAPKSLFEKYGLTKNSGAPEGVTPPSGARSMPEGKGDADLPSTAPSGASKSKPKASPSE